MQKHIAIALASALLSLSAQAGFVDERTSGKPATTAAGADAADRLAPALVVSTGAPVFSVEASDTTVRSTLVRWAKAAGWSHGPAHWLPNRDHPIEGTAGSEVFGASFEDAVRVLVSSTELTDTPVQPCFYSNRVLRIVPIAASCKLGD